MKRVFDFVLASLALTILAIPMIVVALMIRRKLGSPVIFRQLRPGLHGHPFRLLKFRTMTDERDSEGALLPDSARLVPFGRFLRASSIDELPSLWNVIVGEISIVGPRPLAMQYLSLYSREQARRHDVRPGITGWAQVNGRNAISWNKKFLLDIWYVENQSIFLDLKIIALTIKKVLARSDVLAEGQNEVRTFDGTN